MPLFIAIAVGFIFHLFFPQLTIYTFPAYEYLLYSLLAIGLYAAVHGIELNDFRTHRALIFRAITFGVVLKALFIGGIFWLLFQNPYAFLFGIILAQIDPLSVAHLVDTKTSAFSAAGKTILRAWSSFDDPMTVLLALYIFLPMITTADGFSFSSYVFQLGANLLFAFVIYLTMKVMGKQNVSKLILLLLAFLLAIPLKLMLGIALVALFLRPEIKQLSLWTQAAFIIAACILGSLIIVQPANILYGGILGGLAFAAQALATALVAPKIKYHDKIFLAVAQYNGITAIILALIIAEWVPETISVIAFAILTINALYYVSNYALEKKYAMT